MTTNPRTSTVQTVATKSADRVADPPRQRVVAAQEYVVQKRDTLSKIAYFTYGEERLWAEVYSYNRHRIGNDANVLIIGTRLLLPPIDYRLSSTERAAIIKSAASAQTRSATMPKLATIQGKSKPAAPKLNMSQAVNGTARNSNQVPSNQTTQRDVVVFFIGGAGDKEDYYHISGPNGNVLVPKGELDSRIAQVPKANFYHSYYFGYDEVCGEEDIKNHVLSDCSGRNEGLTSGVM